MNSRDKIKAINFVHQNFIKLLEDDSIDDLSFIGNTGGHYKWEPAQIIDIDILLFIKKRSLKIGNDIISLRNKLGDHLRENGFDFEFRVIRGPYKPTPLQIIKPIAFVHLAILTSDDYEALHPTLKWTWKKYKCVKDLNRLNCDNSHPPKPQDLMAFVEGKLEWINNGEIKLQETILPDFDIETQIFNKDDSMFCEYCLAAVSESARIHGRVLGFNEADSLGNKLFCKWYTENILYSASFKSIMKLKEIVRNYGYENAIDKAPIYAKDFLEKLRHELINKMEMNKVIK